MTIRVAINGFGRIGRLVMRSIFENKHTDIEVVAINDLGPVESNAHLFAYDSVHGPFGGAIDVVDGGFKVDGKLVQCLTQKDPAQLPWGDLNIDVVYECTGLFTARALANKHIEAGAKRVLISAPSADADLTVVYGVNDKQLTKDHKVVSNASCTTNCLAPVAGVLHEAVGISSGYMTTIHASTGDQRVVDTLHKDLRRARAASGSMIPTSTGAAKAVGLVLPDLAGRLTGSAIRVPTLNVSVVDLTFIAQRPTTVEAVNKAIAEASQGPLKKVLGYNTKPLVSADFNHCAYSSVFDATQTDVIDDVLVRVVSWYDNEWGFSNRMVDVTRSILKAT